MIKNAVVLIKLWNLQQKFSCSKLFSYAVAMGGNQNVFAVKLTLQIKLHTPCCSISHLRLKMILSGYV